MKGKLAIFSGEPIRKKEFKLLPYIDDEEYKLINNAIRNYEFSRYSGHYSEERRSFLKIKSTEAVKIKDFWSSLGGNNVRKFEADFSRFFNVNYSIAVNSATSALSVAIGACGIGPGDEVVTTPLTFTATSTSVLVFNAIPVFVDVDPETFNIDTNKIEQLISKRTKAILVVHLFGLPCDLDKIMKIAKKYNLYVIEDCAQAIGSKYKNQFVGTIGDIGVFSFQQTKNIMTGEGGMIITNNEDLAIRARLIRNHGESAITEDAKEQDICNIIGFNFRMTELTACLGIAQLKKLNYLNKIRNKNALFLIEKLKKFEKFGLILPYKEINFDDFQNIFHILILKYNEKVLGIKRDVIVAALNAEGIPVSKGYSRLNYENPIFLRKILYGINGCPYTCKFSDNKIEYKKNICPVAEKLIKEDFIWFYHIGFPTEEKDLYDVIKGFEKVFNNIELLKEKQELILSSIKERALR